VVVGACNNLFPKVSRAHFAIYPFAVCALHRALFFNRFRRFGYMYKFKFMIVFDSLHQSISHTDRDVEIAQVTFVFCADKFFNVGMVAAEYTHLSAAPCAGRLNGFARAIKYTHVRNRPAGTRIGPFDMGTLGANGGKIIPHSAAAPHGFSSLLQRIVNAWSPIAGTGYCIANRLYETIDQGCLYFQSGSRIDPSCGHKAILLRLEESFFPMCSLVGLFGLRQTTRYSSAHVLQ
jgi:hypothetical protein